MREEVRAGIERNIKVCDEQIEKLEKMKGDDMQHALKILHKNKDAFIRDLAEADAEE